MVILPEDSIRTDKKMGADPRHQLDDIYGDTKDMSKREKHKEKRKEGGYSTRKPQRTENRKRKEDKAKQEERTERHSSKKKRNG